MKTAEEIFEDMLGFFEACAGYGVNTGCDMAVRLRAAAEEIANAKGIIISKGHKRINR